MLGERIPPGAGITGWSVRHRKTACVNDVHQDPRYYGGLLDQVHSSVRSILCAPLVYQGEVKGAITAIDKYLGDFNPEDISLIEASASIAAVAIQNALMFNDIRTHAREMEIVNSISQSINSSLNSAFILDTALYQFKDLFRADLVGYFEVDPETDQVIVNKVLPDIVEDSLLGANLPPGKVLTGLFKNCSPVVIANAGQDERIRYWIARYPDFASGTLMLAPLVNNQKVVGVMLVARLRFWTLHAGPSAGVASPAIRACHSRGECPPI